MKALTSSIDRVLPGKPERSKVVTLILCEYDMQKAKSVAAKYAKRFQQHSVMMVKVLGDEWSFVGPESIEEDCSGKQLKAN